MEPKIVLNSLKKIYLAPTSSISDAFSKSTQTEQQPIGKLAVDNVSLTIGKGDRLGIVGPNGAGKSTLLHMIAGMSAPTSGSVEISGKVTAIMTLGVGLREHLSGRENIYVDGEIQNKPRQEIDKIIDEIISFSELDEFIDYPVRTYSTGMKARLAFSMIIHIDPEILIIDEALSVGDAVFAAKATKHIQQICAKGKIVIIVSHSMGSIQSMCNRCLWMENGRVLMDGTPDEVTKAYIDAVRSADEAQLLSRFKKLIGARSLSTGWEIIDVAILDGKSSERRTVLEAGQPAHIEVMANVPLDVIDAQIRLQIVRLDGLVVFDETFDTAEFKLESHAVGLEIRMDSLMLGTAVYRLDVDLERLGETLAQHSSIFEVYTLSAPTGGKPTLLYPISASAFPE